MYTLVEYRTQPESESILDETMMNSTMNKSSDRCKTQRKRLHNKKKGFEDKNSEQEGTVYASGAFS